MEETSNAENLIQALHERRERAKTVAADYDRKLLSPFVWQVTHPEDEGRSYVVDILAGTCTCPDFTCRMKTTQLPWCKHLLALCLDVGDPHLERMIPTAPDAADLDSAGLRGKYGPGPYTTEQLEEFRRDPWAV